jgi:DNA-binding NtrC family response regulator
MTKKILIGDDNKQVRNSLARALKIRELESDLASTPQETITKARSGEYYAVITDLGYTKDGREGYNVLRAIADLHAVKILYTGQMGFEYAAEAFSVGADYAVLRKDQKQLMEVLDLVVKQEGREFEIRNKTRGEKTK